MAARGLGHDFDGGDKIPGPGRARVRQERADQLRAQGGRAVDGDAPERRPGRVLIAADRLHPAEQAGVGFYGCPGPSTWGR